MQFYVICAKASYLLGEDVLVAALRSSRGAALERIGYGLYFRLRLFTEALQPAN